VKFEVSTALLFRWLARLKTSILKVGFSICSSYMFCIVSGTCTCFVWWQQ